MNRPESAPPERSAALEAAFRLERHRLRALAYRVTGCGTDADDVVQEAFARLAALPEDSYPPVPGAWLWRVVTNLAIDLLRRRRRRRYVGPWLPAPVETSALDLVEGLPEPGLDPTARYELAESATYAFLLALEILGPRQRAVLLLRDVFCHSAEETAALLGISEGNVRILHLRARRALESYDRSRCIPTEALRERHRAALTRFLKCLNAGDLAGLESLFADDIITLTDSGGEFTALARPLAGRTAVARLYQMAAEHRREGGTREDWMLANGLPAVRITLLRPVRRQAPQTLLRCELDENDRIRVVHAILAPKKLAAFRGL